MEDVKAMQAVFSKDTMKPVLSQLSLRTHGQIVAYWQERSKEWLSAQQFVTRMGRDCTRTMAVRLNEWNITYENLQETFDEHMRDEESFNKHLCDAGVTRKAWRSKIWFHFSKKQKPSS